MQQRIFDQYQFDLDTLRLKRGKQSVALRPKAALILKLLVDQPGEVVTKQTLLQQAWGHRLTADQNLFQAISELRKTFAPLEPVLTHPNRGYSWCIPTQYRDGDLPDKSSSELTHNWATRFGYQAKGLAAACALLIGAAGLLSQSPADRTAGHKLSPALTAFNSGLETLASDPAQASQYFSLTLTENPQFLEARLMLAQSLLLSGDMDLARTEAEHLYALAVDRQLHYLQVSVMGLLSRLDDSAGRSRPALQWARSALDKATEQGFACAAADADRLLNDLLTQYPEAVLSSTRPRASASGSRTLTSATEQSLAQACDPLLGESTIVSPGTDPTILG